MIIKKHHSWDLSHDDAAIIQKNLRKNIVLYDDMGHVGKIAGTDVKYIENSYVAIAAVLILSYPDLELIEVNTCKAKADFPYIPGLFAFREGPVIEKCFKKIKNTPDLVFFDGHGYSHPRRFGLASHILKLQVVYLF